MKTRKIYTGKMYQQFRYLATWLPGTPMELGDIGILRGKEFIKIGNISDHGISFDIEHDNTPTDLDHTSKNAVSISAKLSGSPTPPGSFLAQADAGISVKFSKENAILFKAKNTTTPAIKDQIKLGKEILKLNETGLWNHNWCVITELVHAESCSIIISSSKEGQIDLKASADIQINSLSITDTDLQFANAFSKDLSTTIIAQSGLTPLFKVSKVRRRLLGSPVFKARGIDSMKLITQDYMSKQKDEFYFGQPDFDHELEDLEI
ncbi:hypothetical protein M0D21_10350 [Aquimarina sp. D1M17]|uniref:hypothetical protein n=1 Tax=Aquimarina acroporae TaxID=2937283 RepID=UPI0020BD8B24|nr:hypothetical protein [Aquimarina acroporae]MCK8521969.1 hypothetical protein [Aquimarina acroporae]